MIHFAHNRVKVYHTPGHSPGHVCFEVVGSGSLISGDLIFEGSIGRTDFPGCNQEVSDWTRRDRKGRAKAGSGGEMHDDCWYVQSLTALLVALRPSPHSSHGPSHRSCQDMKRSLNRIKTEFSRDVKVRQSIVARFSLTTPYLVTKMAHLCTFIQAAYASSKYARHCNYSHPLPQPFSRFASLIAALPWPHGCHDGWTGDRYKPVFTVNMNFVWGLILASNSPN